MRNIEIVEAASGGPFVVQSTPPGYAPRQHVITDPADLSFMEVLLALKNEHAPLPDDLRAAEWKRALIFERWSAHYDLPDFQSAQRLAYLVDRYRSALVYDLRTLGVDLGELWRQRRWRTLLDLIDHLPPHSWYSAAVSGDVEHAEMIAESLAARAEEGEQTNEGPSLQSWTPEVAAITRLTDEVRRLHYIIPAVQGDKGVKPPEPLPRPHTPLEAAIKRASFNKRMAQHKALAARLLPHKRTD